MKKYEYMVASHDINNVNDLEVRDYINEFSKVGWKLISTNIFKDRSGIQSYKLFFEKIINNKTNK